uniref:EGF-like domain-containing protein n=1 Tax=Electrophorus electricus TaxID=8005 RepID=A0AAY5EXL2_ELEEL
MISSRSDLCTFSLHYYQEDWQPPTEARTARDLTVTELTKPGINSTDVADSISHADSLHISTTVTRTLLSITSNSSFPYIEDTSSSETVPRTVTLGGGSTGVTHGRNYPDGLLSTESDHSSATSDDHLPMNATQGTVPRSEVPHVFLGTQYQTGQPNVTGPGFAGMADSTSPESSPSFTEFNSEANTTADSSTSGASYTDRSMLSPSVPPSVPPENSHAITSHHDSDTVATETVTGRVSTSLGDVEEPQTHMEETTISGLTTAPLAPSDVDTTVQESFSKFLFGQQSFVPPTDHSSDGLTTASGPQTQRPQNTEEGTNMASTIPVASTRLASTSTAASITTQNVQPSTTALMHIAHTTLVITDTTQVLTTPTTEQYAPTSRTATPLQHPSSSQPGDMGTDVNTPHQETSTATPGTTTKHTTAFYTRSTPARTTAVVSTGRHTVKGPTEKETTTTQMSLKSTPSPGVSLKPNIIYLTTSFFKLADISLLYVDECVSNPCPQDSVCVNTRGSFNCECALGYDLEDGRSCTQGRGSEICSTVCNLMLSILLSLIKYWLLNASLSILHGYRRSTLRDKDGLHIMNMFSMSANVTTHEVNSSIQMSLKNCGKPQSVCSLHQRYQLTYQTESLCLVQKNRCDTQYSQSGSCLEEQIYGLIAKVVSPAAGGFLLLVIIALIVTCCRKDKNDINKIIFKSGDLQMSPYPEFPKSSRVSLEWGRETIEMQENGSTKNLLQMTDIYYSPALRNADLERNGLYPFSGLPGSRHSCIYPAQWNPSFISDDSRRRDYF